MDWSRHYPEFYPPKENSVQKKVEFADIGCGYGGLLIALAPLYPDTLMLGRFSPATHSSSSNMLIGL